MDLWPLVREERLALADLLDGLEPAQWSTPSLCTAWTVKDVAAHVAPTVGGGLGTFALALLRSRLDPHRASERVVAAASAVPPGDIVADLRANAGQRTAPPGLGVGSQLADVIVHTLDVAVPLGIAVERPDDHWRETLDWLTGPQAQRGFVRPGRPAVRLVADDVDWAAGEGPVAHAPAAALALALCGRTARLDGLDGPGAHDLARWARGTAEE